MTNARETLRLNARRLAKKLGMWFPERDEPNQSAIGRATRGRLNQTTIGYMLKDGQVSPKVDSVEVLAEAFGVQPWQLLVPNMDPFNPPTLSSDENLVSLSPEERRLILMFREVTDADRAQAINLLASTWAAIQLSRRKVDDV